MALRSGAGHACTGRPWRKGGEGRSPRTAGRRVGGHPPGSRPPLGCKVTRAAKARPLRAPGPQAMFSEPVKFGGAGGLPALLRYLCGVCAAAAAARAGQRLINT